ncbi:transposase [Streptomyces sp. NPDC005476]|uniref:transposase n=1 Tax=Streptomyces sp. NPDC005476 TaxID=3156882 RepID=UPI003454BB1C
MGVDLSQRLVPDGLGELVAPLLPSFNFRPQGGGTAPCDERAVFTAVVYVLTSGCAWRHLPETFGVSPATAHRWFTAPAAFALMTAALCPSQPARAAHRTGPGCRSHGVSPRPRVSRIEKGRAHAAGNVPDRIQQKIARCFRRWGGPVRPRSSFRRTSGGCPSPG